MAGLSASLPAEFWQSQHTRRELRRPLPMLALNEMGLKAREFSSRDKTSARFRVPMLHGRRRFRVTRSRLRGALVPRSCLSQLRRSTLNDKDRICRSLVGQSGHLRKHSRFGGSVVRDVEQVTRNGWKPPRQRMLWCREVRSIKGQVGAVAVRRIFNHRIVRVCGSTAGRWRGKLYSCCGEFCEN